jgi:hypothetical protein
MTQPAKVTEYRTNMCMLNQNGTTREPDSSSGWENESLQFTATNEMDLGRNSVELVHMVSRPILTLVQN